MTHIQIYGERCSGTNYLKFLLELNLLGFEFTEEFGTKHFFPKNLHSQKVEETIFVVIARNPYDYLRSLHQNPWHTDDSLRNIPFSEFIRKQWKCVYNSDLRMSEDHPDYGKEMMHERNPETGERFKNVLQMRSAKYNAWLQLKKYSNRVFFINYESLNANPQLFVKQFSERFNLPRKARFQNHNLYKDHKLSWKRKMLYWASLGQIGGYKPKTYPPLSSSDLRYISENLDRNLELHLGYCLTETPENSTLKSDIQQEDLFFIA